LHNEGLYLLSPGGSQNKELKDFHKRQQMETVNHFYCPTNALNYTKLSG